MALRNRSLFLYGLQITELNSSIDFKGAITDTSARQATLRLGFYALNALAREIKRALQEADPLRIYTVTVDRTVLSGTQNRVTISSNGAFFQLLFASGPRAATSVAPLIGFNTVDYTGFTTYTGSASAGTRLLPEMQGYNYVNPDEIRRVFGSVNVSASGLKEAIVWNEQRFAEVEFKYEPQAKVSLEWTPFWVWAIRQRGFEFTPDISDPATFYEVTLERTEEDSKGLAYRMPEMLPQFPFFYRTGKMVMRQSNEQILGS